jgi:hypothetical protein
LNQIFFFGGCGGGGGGGCFIPFISIHWKQVKNETFLVVEKGIKTLAYVEFTGRYEKGAH